MKRTARLITSIAAIVLTLVIMSVGIYAATKISISNPSNNIKFVARDVAATITATKQMGDATAQPLAITSSDNSNIENGAFRPSFKQGENYTGTMDIGDIQFTNLEATFTLTVTIKNDLTSAAINVKYNAATSDTNGYVTINSAYSNDNKDLDSYPTAGIDVAAGKTLVITTTITIVSEKVDTILESGFNIPFSFSLNLERATSAA